MRLRRLLGLAAGAVGATALANRALDAKVTGFQPMLDGDQRTYRWRGFDVAYTEAGDPEDPDLVLFHGVNAAASSHEFHAVFDALAEEYHVVAPDLPGFGHSDRPPLLYSASLLTTFVSDFLHDESDDPIVVASSLTASYAAAAARDADVNGPDVRELVLVCPTDSSMGDRQTWLRTLLRSPVVGQGLFNAMVSEHSLRYFNADHGYFDESNLTQEVLDYEWATAHQPGARFAPASFVSGFLDPEADLSESLAAFDGPVTLVWGREAETSPLTDGRALAEEVDARLVVFDESRLLPHVEYPEKFVEVVHGSFQTVEA